MYQKAWQKIVLKNPGQALDFTANVAGAVASRNPKAALSTLPDMRIFVTQEKRFTL